MAYGVTSTSFLLSLGLSPASASASVHTSEIFTTLTSGLSHLKLKNVDKSLFKRLLIPGMIGGALGAYILTSVPTEIIKPLVGIYLLIMGLLILRRLFDRKKTQLKTNLTLLGGVGGFLDAIGGGGWGPVVTSTLVARGDKPRLTIGSVNSAEFFVTLTEAATFFTILGITHLEIIIGLIIGGVIAAPLAAYTCKKLPPRILMAIVGTVIVAL
ncbi:sulfite exporter TauE/SafE family protein, partial [Candidatus Bathyarchaeota archaeon]|nr:sulfite exporter TauE/SafE family protein [Candidatus Bathyarchaeota archaeon]